MADCVITDAGDGAGASADDETAEIEDVGGGTAADVERAESPTVDGDGVVAKRRRLTCSMESVEDKQEKMDDKNCGTSAGTCFTTDDNVMMMTKVIVILHCKSKGNKMLYFLPVTSPSAK